jgi:hypothetical protein
VTSNHEVEDAEDEEMEEFAALMAPVQGHRFPLRILAVLHCDDKPAPQTLNARVRFGICAKATESHLSKRSARVFLQSNGNPRSFQRFQTVTFVISVPPELGVFETKFLTVADAAPAVGMKGGDTITR